MKRFGVILTASLLVLTSAGAGYFYTSRRAVSAVSLAERRAEARVALLLGETPLARFQPPAGDELMNPERALPFSHRFALDDLRRVKDFTESCRPELAAPFVNYELEKARLFAAHECGLSAELPRGFFSTPPFMHPSGRSYVALALDSERAEFRAPEWVQANARRLHVLERRAFAPVTGALDPLDVMLEPLGRDDLQALWRGEQIVAVADHVFLYAQRSTSLGVGGEYLVYSRVAWDDLLAASAVSPALLTALAVTALLALLVLSGTLATFAWVRVLEKRRERDDQMFVVRALTHELRTPATSLGLTLETLRADFDGLPERSQEAFLSIAEQVQRLNRVIAGTTRYLKTEEAREAPAGKLRLPSLKDFFASVLEPYQDQIVVDDLPADRGFAIDPYLLKVCVQNLVENAVRHGRPEVRVRVSLDGLERLEVEVRDQGTLPTTDPAQLSAHAAYGASHGLGLGLHVVTKIVKDLKGSLSLARHPATFTLRFEEAK